MPSAPKKDVTADVMAPALEIAIEPSSVRKGEAALLTWQAQNAERVVINQNIGSVSTYGKIKFFPEEKTTYTVTAEGRGGVVEKSVTVEILESENHSVLSEDLSDRPLDERFNYFVKPVFFEFDSAELSDEAELTLEGNIRWLQNAENRSVRFTVEGHCDQRGTEEYNLALGDLRALVVREYLVKAGIEPARITTISYGEEHLFDTAENEEAYALNRRAHFVVAP